MELSFRFPGSPSPTRKATTPLAACLLCAPAGPLSPLVSLLWLWKAADMDCPVGSLVFILQLGWATGRQELCKESDTLRLIPRVSSLWACCRLAGHLHRGPSSPQLAFPTALSLTSYFSPLSPWVVTLPHCYLTWVPHYFLPLFNTLLPPLYQLHVEPSSNYPS